ncbi:hypothetical protein BD410DRAFT_795590 [Rickenella mellea]|uniref:Ricin B lectin domain-containing protein n=1 Tax=Rickenella mellea TaxID=50990 RepID=A0A4Y7PM96_9AGAM|nr:hypothetical protein BD410DRAFT_797112 [Rickenella mellea]TDL16248.1 hypothetical protein BD410DRAFT_795590 [Rickenella mellea]
MPKQITGKLTTGRYHIQNADNGLFLELTLMYEESPVICTHPSPTATQNWDITDIGHGLYMIRNQAQSLFANTKPCILPKRGMALHGKAQKPDAFLIKETTTPGKYWIYTDHSRVYWFLPRGQIDTEVAFGIESDSRNQWSFFY